MKRADLLLSFLFLSCCCQQLPPIPSNVKVYSVQEELVRLQVKETLAFAKARGYLCASPQNFSDTVSCVGGGVKIYSLQPSMGGLYRKQANELLPYAGARGYLCTSPKDFTFILDQCAN